MGNKPKIILELEDKLGFPIKSYFTENEILLEISLFKKKLKKFPIVEGLKKINVLDLSENQIEDIESIEELVNLKNVFLSDNKIKKIDALSKLLNIEILHLAYNEIEDIKPIYGLKSLVNLDLRFNKITTVSLEWLKNCRIEKVVYDNKFNHRSINLFGNPLDIAMIEAIESGGKLSLIKYLEARERGTVKIPEAKMILLGEPRAGKTSLQRYLMGLSHNFDEESTKDIQISSWKPFENEEIERKEIKINLWDFGGQEIQYSLHKLFMTDETLYIIVLDSTKDQSPLKYLEFLENHVPNAPFIIINNFGDAPTANSKLIDENYLRETYDGTENKPILKGIFKRVSVRKAAENDPSWHKIMDEVEECIKKEILNLSNLNKEFPTEYQKVKEAISNEYLKADKHYITMTYYRELCKSLQITDSEDLRIAILKYLNQIGILRYFDNSSITDKHILNPKWLIDGAYSLLIHPETERSYGVLTKKQAFKILKESKNFTFYENEAEFIFLTMKYFGLLYSDENSEKIYLPIRFESKQPTTLSDFYEKGQHFVFEFKSNIPEDVISYLIVYHFTEIRNQLFWSKGAIFEKDNIRILAKVEDRSIHFYIQGRFHQSYFGIIRNTLLRKLETLAGLGYEEIVEFEFENKNVKAKYNHLVKVLNTNKKVYSDLDNDIEIESSEIIKILGGYFSTSEIRNITNNFYGNYYDNRYQSNFFINELKTIAETTNETEDKVALKELISELEVFKKEKAPEKKEGIGKRLMEKIKKISTTARDEAVKETVKKVFPEIVEMGKETISNIDFDGIMQIFGGFL